MKLEKQTELNYGRDIISSFIVKNCPTNSSIKILDIGCGLGGDLENAKNTLQNKSVELFGIEINLDYAETNKNNGIKISSLDIESATLPFEKEYFDIIIINQVLEHTKEIFFITSQANRVLKKGGILIVGVPNLAALHNRILLLLGRQPACIKTLSAHIRGFTKKDLISFFQKNGFSLLNFAGSNFYPFPKKIAKILSSIFPTFSVCIFAAFKKTGETITLEKLKELNFETNFKL